MPYDIDTDRMTMSKRPEPVVAPTGGHSASFIPTRKAAPGGNVTTAPPSKPSGLAEFKQKWKEVGESNKRRFGFNIFG